MIKITVNCSKCHNIKRVSQIHINIPIILVLECGHKVEITNLQFGISQEV